MFETTTITVDPTAPESWDGRYVGYNQMQTASGELVWAWIAWALGAYWILFITGGLIGLRQLNVVGAAVILGILGWAALERLWVKIDGVVVASVAAALLTLISMAGTFTSESADAVFKYVCLCMVIAVARILRLPPAASSHARWWLAAPILAVLGLCVFVIRGSSWDGGTRHSGLFVNPNSLALIPLLLLFLIDRDQDKRPFRIAAHLTVVAVLVFSGTSGALVAYAAGLMLHVGPALARVWRTGVCLVMLLSVAIGATIIASGGQSVLPQTRLTNQLFIIGTQAQNVFNGGSVNFYGLEQRLGSGSTSGLWRLMHWRRAVELYAGGTPAQHMFGFGPGSSATLLGKLPHNEYLRLLLEQGIVGLALFLFIWGQIIVSAPRAIRYIGVIFAIYSITENNLDNFPFMCMSALCLSASGPLAATVPSRSRERAWGAGDCHLS